MMTHYQNTEVNDDHVFQGPYLESKCQLLDQHAQLEFYSVSSLQ